MEQENWMIKLSQTSQIESLKKTNQYTEKFGVKLSDTDISVLTSERQNSLKEQERVEFGEGILPSLIYAFCDSAYIYQDNYAESLARLQDIFYLYKNESLDDLTDEELIDYMRSCFDGVCQGSLDYLEDTCLEDFARSIREGTRSFIGKYEDEDE